MARITCASLLIAVIAGGCAGPATSPPVSSPTVTPTAAPTPVTTPGPAVSPTPEATASGWPNVGPPPAAEPAGRVYLAHVVWPDTGEKLQRLMVLDDGRVIVSRYDEPGTRLVQRRLSETGLQFIRSAIADVGLFDKSQSRSLLKPLGCCGAGDEVDVTVQGATIKVSRLLAMPGFYAASAAWDRFDALVSSFTDLDAWIPSGGWSTAEWIAYHAPEFCLSVDVTSLPETGIDVADIDWPAGVLPLASFGEPFPNTTSQRAGRIGSGAAYALAASIVAAATGAGIPNEGWYTVGLEAGGELHTPALRDTAAANAVFLGLMPLPPGGQCPGAIYAG